MELLEIGSIIEVTESWGGRNGKLLFNGTEFVWDDEVVLEMNRELCELTVRRLFRKHLTLLEEKNGECVNSHV